MRFRASTATSRKLRHKYRNDEEPGISQFKRLRHKYTAIDQFSTMIGELQMFFL